MGKPPIFLTGPLCWDIMEIISKIEIKHPQFQVASKVRDHEH